MYRKVSALAVSALLFVSFSAAAQSENGGFSFGLGIGLGVQSFPNPDYTAGSGKEEAVTYQSLSLAPEFAFGKFGIGLDFVLNYRFTAGSGGDEFEVREEDWKVGDFQEFLDVYLPKISYVRYGTKGDELFVMMGTITGATLGNGFIVGGYSNARHLPETRLFGLSFDLDGNLFGVPYFGVETFTANLSRFDVKAARLYLRPFAGSDLPLLPGLQVGGTFAADSEPDYFVKDDADYSGPLPGSDVLVYGADFRLPLLSGDVVSLDAYGDTVFQKEGAGSMVGFGGRLVKIVTYGAQIRYLGDNFIPTYFDSTYDLFRADKYFVYDGTVEKEGGVGWFATLGFSVLQDKIVFTTTMEGPLGEQEGNYYDWSALFMVKEGVLPGFFFDVSYDKKGMAGTDDFLRWRKNALIQARINYKTGPAVISLVYQLRYDPSDPDGWVVTSGIQSKISL